MIRIPVYRPSLDGNEKKYVDECIETSWISSRGRFVGEFEAGFAKSVGVDHAITVCNGTVALHLALVALGLRPGDEVIVPTFTYVASVNAIVHAGATPVFVDALPSTWQMDPEDVRRRITARTRAIMVVHLYGHPCDMQALSAIAREHGLAMVEDCAEAFGTRDGGRHVGTFGDLATFSFFGNKTITTGEGGMVVTRDAELAQRVRKLRGQGLAEGREYWHDVIGYNYRMTNVAAAIGLAQLERADALVRRKREVGEAYLRALQGLPVLMHTESAGTTHSYWMISILVSEARHRDPLRQALADAGIETRPLFPPVHSMPMYAVAGEEHPVARDLAARGMNLPSYPGLTDDDILSVASAIRDYHDRAA